MMLCVVLPAASQKEMISFKNTLKTSRSEIKDVTPIVNSETGDFAIFIADAKNVYAYKLDKNFSVQAKLSSPERRRKYRLLLGSSVSSTNDYVVYLSDNNRLKFLRLQFSFDTQEITEKEFRFDDPKERLLQTVSVKNKFYAFTFHSLKQQVFLYTFDDKGDSKRDELDFSSFTFLGMRGKEISFRRIVTPEMINTPVSKFFENDPQSIESVTELRKLYVRDDKVFFTFDQNKQYTQVASIDLNSQELDVKKFEKPLSDASFKEKKTNSYLNGDYVFVASGTKKSYVLRIFNYTTQELVKEYSIEKDESINFKNTPIMQLGGTYKEYRELEKTKQFLRKINQNKMGLAVFKRADGYQISLGGSQPTGAGVPVPVFSFGNFVYFFNTSALAYSTYYASKSTKIDCLFDNSFNHVEGEIQKNAFDKMAKYQSPVINAQVIFKYDDFYLKGLYDKKTTTYRLRKFTN